LQLAEVADQPKLSVKTDFANTEPFLIVQDPPFLQTAVSCSLFFIPHFHQETVFKKFAYYFYIQVLQKPNLELKYEISS
jgi:hypothetical protein